MHIYIYIEYIYIYVYMYIYIYIYISACHIYECMQFPKVVLRTLDAREAFHKRSGTIKHGSCMGCGRLECYQRDMYP